MNVKFKGVDGSIELADDRVVIRKSIGAGSDTGKDEIQFMLSQIDGIEYSKSSMLMNERGHLAILAAGYRPYQAPQKGEKDSRFTAKNTVTFWSTSNKKAEEFKAQLEQALQNARQLRSAPASAPAELSTADEIAKFKTLLDSGAITQDEYDAKKKQLLGI